MEYRLIIEEKDDIMVVSVTNALKKVTSPQTPTLSQQPGHSLKSYSLGGASGGHSVPSRTILIISHLYYMYWSIIVYIIPSTSFNPKSFFLFFCSLSLSLSPLSSRILLGNTSCSTQLGKLPYTSPPYNLLTAHQQPLPVSPIFCNRLIPAL